MEQRAHRTHPRGAVKYSSPHTPWAVPSQLSLSLSGAAGSEGGGTEEEEEEEERWGGEGDGR